MAIWTKTGTDIIVDAMGNPVECDHCPCDSGDDKWVQVKWYEEYGCDVDACSGDLIDENVSGYIWHPVRECIYDGIRHISIPWVSYWIVTKSLLEEAVSRCPLSSAIFEPGGYYVRCINGTYDISPVRSPCWGVVMPYFRPWTTAALSDEEPGYIYIWTGSGYSLNYAINTPSGIVTPSCSFDPPSACGDPMRPYSSDRRARIGYVRYTAQLQAEYEFPAVPADKREKLISIATEYAPDFITVHGVQPVIPTWELNEIYQPSHVIRVFFEQNGNTNVNDGYRDTGIRMDLGTNIFNSSPFADATPVEMKYPCTEWIGSKFDCCLVENTGGRVYRPSAVACTSEICDFGADCQKPDCVLAYDIGFPPCKDIDSSALEERVKSLLESLEDVPYPMECLDCVTTVKQCRINFSVNGRYRSCSGGPSGSICGTWVCSETFVGGTASGGCSDICLKNSCYDGKPSVSGTVIPYQIYCSSLNGCSDGGVGHAYSAYSGTLNASWVFGHMEDTMQEDGSVKKEFREGKDPVLQECTHASVSISGSISGRCWGYGYSAGTSVDRWNSFGVGGGCSIIVPAAKGKLGSGSCSYTEEGDCTTDGHGCDNRWFPGASYTCSISFSGECSDDDLQSRTGKYNGMTEMYRSSFSAPEEYSDIFESLDQSLK